MLGIWHKGEVLRVSISGHYQDMGEFFPRYFAPLNSGTHILHTGGDYPAHLRVPVCPPKHQSGSYAYR